MGAGPCGIGVIVFVVFGAWGRFDVRLSLCRVSARILSGVGSWKVGVVNTTEGCRGVWILGGGSGSIGGHPARFPPGPLLSATNFYVGSNFLFSVRGERLAWDVGADVFAV